MEAGVVHEECWVEVDGEKKREWVFIENFYIMN